MFCRMTKMAAWEFCLQDGGVSESFTHKIAAWEICLQDGGVSDSLEYMLHLQCRIYQVNVTWPVVIIMSTGRHYNDYRSTVKRWTFDNAQRHVMTFWPISEASCSWSCDKNVCSIWCRLLLPKFCVLCCVCFSESVGHIWHNCDPYIISWTSWDAVWCVDVCGPRNHVFDGGRDPPWEGHF